MGQFAAESSLSDANKACEAAQITINVRKNDRF